MDWNEATRFEGLEVHRGWRRDPPFSLSGCTGVRSITVGRPLGHGRAAIPLRSGNHFLIAGHPLGHGRVSIGSWMGGSKVMVGQP